LGHETGLERWHVQQQGLDTLNVEQILGIIRRRALLIVLCVAVVGGTAYGFSKRETKKYTATASLAFSNDQLSQQVAGLPPTSTANLLAQQANNVELVKRGDMATKTANALGGGLTGERVAGSLSISGQGESSVVTISATETSPELAAKIANTYATEFVREQQETNRRYFKSALALVHKQLRGLSSAQRVGPDGLALQNRAQTLGLLSELNYGNVEVAEEALAPTTPSSPKTSKNTLLGVVFGLLIGLGLAFILERLDRRIRGPKDLESIYRLPMLGAVPKSSALSRSRQSAGTQVDLPPAAIEAFNLIRAHLRFFNVDRDVRTIAIASPASGDGRTTIARHLADAAARLGSRVLLLEADLRHPTLSRQPGIEPGEGLADVLIGAIPMGAVTQSVDAQAPPSETAARRTFDVLAAGDVQPPNPGELLASQAMSAVLEQARSTYDLVVIDTAPLAVVSDAFPLLTKVDGVIVVGRMGHSRHDAAELLNQTLQSSHARLLGIVANGMKTSNRGSHAYTSGGTAGATTPRSVVAASNGSAPDEESVPMVRS
jgi:succinoglycan biosynthesis transport protein ExoP